MPRMIRHSTPSLPVINSASTFGGVFAADKGGTGPPETHLSAMSRFSNQPPFHIINGIAYPCDAPIPIDRVISFIAATHLWSPFEADDGLPQ